MTEDSIKSDDIAIVDGNTGTIYVDPDEAIAIDVSFGDGIDISPDECGKLSSGAMIGISPVLNRKISSKLTLIAKENNIPH